MEVCQKPPEQREPLAGLHIYEAVPTKKLFPKWERTSKLGWIAALTVAGAAGYRFSKPEANKDVDPAPHFAPAFPWTSDKGFNLTPAISHDGKLVAYASDREANRGLAIWLRPFHSGKPVRLTRGDFNETDPDFSPDDRLIAYRSERNGGGIYVQLTDGGAPKLIASRGRRPRFSPDGKWIAFFRQNGPDDAIAPSSLSQVFIVASEGGEPRSIQPSFRDARYPVWAPDGRHLLFAGLSQDRTKDWWLSPIDGREATRTHALERLDRSLKTAGYPDRWTGDSILFSGAEDLDAHIWELPISSSTRQVTGPPRRVSDGKDQEQHVAIGSDGRLLFTGLHLSSEIWSLPIEANQARTLGKLEPLTHAAAGAQLPSIAADGSKMVYLSNKSGLRDIWIGDADGKAGQAITQFRHIGYRPILSPDGKLIVYPTTVNGECGVLLQRLAPPVRTFRLEGCFNVWDWSRDGLSLLTQRSTQSSAVELMTISTGARRTAISRPGSSLFAARLSPDGHWIAFAAGATSAETRVFITPWRGSATPEREWILASPEGGDPAWSPDGNVLYFRSKRDGNLCIWAQKLGPAKALVGEPIPILHLHSTALGIAFLKPAEFGLAVSQDRLTLNLGRTSGTLWTMSLPRAASRHSQ